MSASDISVITKYFPELSDIQKKQFESLKHLYSHWNEQINVISRKDIDLLYERHVLHSLAIAKVIKFKEGSNVLDVGTGGGFPGIPLAILFPDCNFHLVDSIGKKIKVVQGVAEKIGLQNLMTTHQRAEQVPGKFEFIVSRAVTQFPEFLNWVRNKISTKQFNSLPNGIFYLKGGDLRDELKGFEKRIEIFEIPQFFEEEFFETKKVVYYH